MRGLCIFGLLNPFSIYMSVCVCAYLLVVAVVVVSCVDDHDGDPLKGRLGRGREVRASEWWQGWRIKMGMWTRMSRRKKRGAVRVAALRVRSHSAQVEEQATSLLALPHSTYSIPLPNNK